MSTEVNKSSPFDAENGKWASMPVTEARDAEDLTGHEKEYRAGKLAIKRRTPGRQSRFGSRAKISASNLRLSVKIRW